MYKHYIIKNGKLQGVFAKKSKTILHIRRKKCKILWNGRKEVEKCIIGHGLRSMPRS